MQLGSLELQIFVALFLVLGSAFVALVCDFLKGNNEQLRERNIELRVREDERERLGLFEPFAHPITWLQGLAQLIRNPGLADVAASASAPAPATASAPAPATTATQEATVEEPDLDNLTSAASAAAAAAEAERNPQRRHRYDEFKAAAKHQSWATKEELEQLAGRAARIRARHEASHRKDEDLVVAPKAPAPAATAEIAEIGHRPRITELPKLETFTPRPPQVAAPIVVAAEVAEPVPQEIVPAAEPMVAATEPPVLEVAKVEQPIEPAEQPKPVLVERDSDAVPAPLINAAAASSWIFAPAKASHMEAVGAVVATLDVSLPVIKPEAPALDSTLPEAEAEAASPAEAAIAEAEIAEAEIAEAEIVVETPVLVDNTPILVAEALESPALPAIPQESAAEAAINIWLHPELESREEETAASVVPPEPVAVAEPEEEVSPVAVVVEPPMPTPIEQVRTRIQSVDVIPISELETADITPPAMPPPAMPLVEVRAVDTAPAALDVAALQKATGESRIVTRPAASESMAEAKLEIPAGLHDGGVLSVLLENQAPYSGVVVAIGLNDYETLRDKLASGTDSVAALNKMVLSMLRPQDFACRFQDDEYILIYPGERGSSAQRRLFQVSEKLWDFQLRSLGNLSVMFSWGGLEVTNETLAEAVASARERMYQTKRNRKPAGLDFAVGRKKVVNG